MTCKKVQEKVLRPTPTPELPEYRVRAKFPFQVTGFDFACTFFVSIFSKRSVINECFTLISTCATSRFTYLESSTEMASVSLIVFINCCKRFSSCCGTAKKVASDSLKSLNRMKMKLTLKKSIFHGNYGGEVSTNDL